MNLALLFLQASVSAIVTTSLAWAVLQLARWRWPGLDARRSPWLLAPLVGCLTFLLVLLPDSSQLSLIGETPVPYVAALPLLPVDAPIASAPATDLLTIVALLWLAIYLTGGAWHALRWMRGQRHVRALLCAAERLDDAALAAHPAFTGHLPALPPVLEIDAAVSPMLAGLRHPVLLLPHHIRDLPPAQQQLIVAHELMHLRRRDHAWQHVGVLLQGLLWFVPAVHACYRRLQWALETGCDRAVLAGRPASERRSYAAALLAQLSLQPKDMASASLAFGLHDAHAMADRIRLIRDAGGVDRSGWPGMAMLLLVPALGGASVLLQPQFVWEKAAQMAPAAPAAIAWLAPLTQWRVTSAFGSTHRPGSKPHAGMDLGARRGTAVLAPAAGRVVISTDRYAGGAQYGKVIVIEHADHTSTLYAHLDGRLVAAGDTVAAGQRIALSGATGKVTGPHLHFEVSRGGAQIDPQILLRPVMAAP